MVYGRVHEKVFWVQWAVWAPEIYWKEKMGYGRVFQVEVLSGWAKELFRHLWLWGYFGKICYLAYRFGRDFLHQVCQTFSMHNLCH